MQPWSINNSLSGGLSRFCFEGMGQLGVSVIWCRVKFRSYLTAELEDNIFLVADFSLLCHHSLFLACQLLSLPSMLNVYMNVEKGGGWGRVSGPMDSLGRESEISVVPLWN